MARIFAAQRHALGYRQMASRPPSFIVPTRVGDTGSKGERRTEEWSSRASTPAMAEARTPNRCCRVVMRRTVAVRVPTAAIPARNAFGRHCSSSGAWSTDLPMTQMLADRLRAARDRLDQRGRQPRRSAPRAEMVYELISASKATPNELRLEIGLRQHSAIHLGGRLGTPEQKVSGIHAHSLGGPPRVDQHSSRRIRFRERLLERFDQPGVSRAVVGRNLRRRHERGSLGVGSWARRGHRPGAFMAPLGHIAARLHAIGQQAPCSTYGDSSNP